MGCSGSSQDCATFGYYIRGRFPTPDTGGQQAVTESSRVGIGEWVGIRFQEWRAAGRDLVLSADVCNGRAPEVWIEGCGAWLGAPCVHRRVRGCSISGVAWGVTMRPMCA